MPATALPRDPVGTVSCICSHRLTPRPPGGRALPGETMPTLPMPAFGQMVPTYITSLVVIFSIELVNGMIYFANTPIAYATIVKNNIHGTSGGATLSVEPTPQKRGPLPKPIWRRGRLPFCLARPRRPKLPVVLRLPYKNLLIALWIILLPRPLSVGVARPAPARRAARAMVRVGMESMATQGKVSDSEFLAKETATCPRNPEDENAAERYNEQSAALTSTRPCRESCA